MKKDRSDTLSKYSLHDMEGPEDVDRSIGIQKGGSSSLLVDMKAGICTKIYDNSMKLSQFSLMNETLCLRALQ